MNDTIDLRGAIEALSAKPCCRRYPADLRARIKAHARAQLSRGASKWRIAQRLNIGSGTLERFLAADQVTSLVPVRIIDEGMVRQEAAAGIVVRGGCGVTIEGLAVGDVAALLRALS